MHILPAEMQAPPIEVDHPFMISTALDVDFGYSSDFISGASVWDTTAVSGGGRYPASTTLAKMRELGDLTRAGAPLSARQTALATCWHQHYDATRIEFISHFLLGDAISKSPKLNKSAAIEKLVELNAPFIPFVILNEHLKRGLTKFKGKSTFPAVSWEEDYAAFCKNTPFGDDTAARKRKDEKLALAIDYWQLATESHNKDVPANEVLKLTDKEIEKLSGSQFSLSVRGTPTFHQPALPRDSELRSKLLMVSNELNAKREKIRQAEDFERKAAELRGSISGGSRVPPNKRKAEEDEQSASSRSEREDKGTHALNLFLTATKRKVELAEYIDFASMSESRIKEIKMLNCTTSKSSKLAVGIVLRHSLSESDVAILTDDFSQIADGFLYHYLKVVSESNLEDPLATIMDRLSWWQWMCRVFGKNFAAQVKFIKNFMVEHHDQPFWTPLVKLETNLVILCKEQAPLLISTKTAKKESSGKPTPTTKAGKKQGNQKARAVLTAAQLKKIEDWKLRFPNTCMSRMVRGRNCFKENNGGVCRFSHSCAWCGSASCKADCSQAEVL